MRFCDLARLYCDAILVGYVTPCMHAVSNSCFVYRPSARCASALAASHDAQRELMLKINCASISVGVGGGAGGSASTMASAVCRTRRHRNLKARSDATTRGLAVKESEGCFEERSVSGRHNLLARSCGTRPGQRIAPTKPQHAQLSLHGRYVSPLRHARFITARFASPLSCTHLIECIIVVLLDKRLFSIGG